VPARRSALAAAAFLGVTLVPALPLAAATAAPAPAATVARPGAPARQAVGFGRLALIGDSVSAAAKRELTTALARFGATLTVDAAPCRGVLRSCTAPGVPVRPATGVAVAGRLAADTVVVELGYNDTPTRAELARMVATLKQRGVQHILWLTLHDARPGYRAVNASLAALAAADPAIDLVDWRAASQGHPEWFTDGVHLTRAGAAALAAVVAAHLTAKAGAMGLRWR
jgi:hypothetical protein